MMTEAERWKGIYRIPSARADWWDYANSGAYFITICAKNMTHFFGECENGEMKHNILGFAIQGAWYEIPNRFPLVALGKCVVMPNHFHGIIYILSDNENEQPEMTGKGGITGKNNPMQKNNIARFVRWFKGRSAFEIRKIAPEFEWQTRYYDNIIRSPEKHQIIENYIQNNPKKMA